MGAMTITYLGHKRPGNEFIVQVLHGDGDFTPGTPWMEPLPHLVRHSPDGFSWGYEGSGPAELARCILLHALVDQEAADRLYQEFKRAYVARWGQRWSIGQEEVREWVEGFRLLERAGVAG